MSTPLLPCKPITYLANESTPEVVLVRASLNVPITNGEVKNQFRITRGMATLNYLKNLGCKIVVCGHIGDGTESTKPLVSVYSSLGFTASHVGEVTGPTVKNAIDVLAPGDILVLENVRSDPREKKNDAEFARELADLADVYVNDAFAASHREHASLVGVPTYLPSYAGHNFMHEYEALVQMRSPKHPALFLLGGAKFDTKMPLVEQFIEVYDHVFIGGALAHDLFKAKGYEVGDSLVSDIDLSSSPLLQNEKLLMPIDVIVTRGEETITCAPEEVQAGDVILDAGPATLAMLAPYIMKSKHVLWNGPFGNYEQGFATQTLETAKVIAESKAHSVVGGGDTVASIEELCIQEHFSFLSTAGGAMLHFLEKGTLPALEAMGAATK